MTITYAKWEKQLVRALIPKGAKSVKEESAEAHFLICRKDDPDRPIKIKIIETSEPKKVPFKELDFVDPSTVTTK